MLKDRKNILKKTLMASVFITSSFIAVGAMPIKDAIACNCINYGQAKGLARETQDHFTSRIGIMEQAITNMIALATGQIVNTLKEQVQGEAQIAQTQDQRDVVRRIEDIRLDATLAAQTSPSACESLSGIVVNQSGDSAVHIMMSAMAELNEEWDKGLTGNEATLNDTGSIEHTRQARISNNAQFCDIEMQHLGLCSNLTTEGYRGASLNASKSILKNNTYDPMTQQAAQTFTLNAINPTPQGTMPAHIMRTEQGTRILADRQAVRARTSMAEYFTSRVRAKRAPQNRVVSNPESGSRQTRRKWSEEMASNLIGYSPDGTNFPYGVSWMDWMELYSKQWAFNPEWHNRMSSESVHPTVYFKEMTNIMSWLAYQNWEQYKLMEEMGAMQAVQLAIMAEETR